MTLSDRIATVRKAVVTLVGVVSALLTANLLPAEWAPYISTAVGILTIIATYQVPNAIPKAERGYMVVPQTPGVADHADPEA